MTSDGADFIPEVDLLRRYETMIDTQVETINGIDDKAAFTARLVGLLGGLLLTAVSIGVTVDRVTFTSDAGVPIVAALLGSILLVISLMLAIITYLSSRFEYGPSASLGPFIANTSVDSDEYLNAMLTGYSQAIRVNRQVVTANANRFEACLATFLGGLILLLTGGGLLLIPLHIVVEGGILLGAIGTSIAIMVYIRSGAYQIVRDNPIHD